MATRLFAGALSMLAFQMACAAGVGIVRSNANDGVQVFLTDPVRAGETVLAQYPDAAGRTRCCVKLGRLATVPSDATAMDARSGEPLRRYRIENAPPAYSSAGQAPFLGIVVVGSGVSARQISANEVRFRVRGASLTAHSCTSTEGLHVSSKRGSAILADAYLGFGYDVEGPTCPSHTKQ